MIRAFKSVNIQYRSPGRFGKIDYTPSRSYRTIECPDYDPTAKEPYLKKIEEIKKEVLDII